MGITSCDCFNESLPECRLYVKFKYDYNLLSVDAFHTQVDKVELYVFDKDGKFLFSQVEEGEPLSTGNYLMEVEIPIGEYLFMAWAGASDSYDVPILARGVSTIEELKLMLKREESLVINKELESLWYGEILDVTFTGKSNQVETINLIKDTNKIRFMFENQSTKSVLDINKYSYVLTESNGYMNYDNSLLSDDVLMYHPHYIEQAAIQTGIIEMNTMRLMTDRKNQFEVKDNTTGMTVFKVDLTEFFLRLRLEEHKYKWNDQEYLDRKDSYEVVFFLNSTTSDPWLSVSVVVNGWTWYIQRENTGGEEL